MVEREVDLADIPLRIVGKQVGVRDVGGDNKGGHKAFRRIAWHDERFRPLGARGVRQHRAVLAPPPQAAAQGARAAGRIAVRPAVGQNEDIVRLPQQGGGFGYGDVHASSSPLPILPSRSSSWMTWEMWAPWVMDSSSSKTSSGA